MNDSRCFQPEAFCRAGQWLLATALLREMRIGVTRSLADFVGGLQGMLISNGGILFAIQTSFPTRLA